MASFPGGLASFAGFVASHTLAVDNHAAQHNLEQGEILATQQKVGTGTSTPTSGKVLRGTGVGTSAWGQVDQTTDITGVTPINNGGTGVTNLTFPSGPETLVGRASLDTLTNKTLTTPTIASFTNAQHNHTNAAGGGTLTGSTAIIDNTLTSEKLNSTVAFLARLTGNQGSITTGTAITMQTAAELFDTGNDFDAVSTFAFIAPYNGIYHFDANAQLDAPGEDCGLFIVVNGAIVARTDITDTTAANDRSAPVSITVNLASGDSVIAQVFHNAGSDRTIVGTVTGTCYFSGFLVGRI